MEQNRNVDQPVVYKSRSRGNGVSNFLSGVAVLLSTLALLFSGFTAYQVFTLQQTLNTTRSTGSVATTNPNQTSAVGNTAPAANTPTQVPSGSGGIQPGQFVQSAFKNKGQVELLRVNRIPTERDVVNVQIRIRLLNPDKAVGSDVISMDDTTARNPQTSETYKAVTGENTGSVSLFMMRIQNKASADAYTWLRVPTGVNTIDIYVPNTQAFTSVPIS